MLLAATVWWVILDDWSFWSIISRRRWGQYPMFHCIERSYCYWIFQYWSTVGFPIETDMRSPHQQLHHQKQQGYLQHSIWHLTNKICTQWLLLQGLHPLLAPQLSQSNLLLLPYYLLQLKQHEYHVPVNLLEIWCLGLNINLDYCSTELQWFCCKSFSYFMSY